MTFSLSKGRQDNRVRPLRGASRPGTARGDQESSSLAIAVHHSRQLQSQPPVRSSAASPCVEDHTAVALPGQGGQGLSLRGFRVC